MSRTRFAARSGTGARARWSLVRERAELIADRAAGGEQYEFRGNRVVFSRLSGMHLVRSKIKDNSFSASTFKDVDLWTARCRTARSRCLSARAAHGAFRAEGFFLGRLKDQQDRAPGLHIGEGIADLGFTDQRDDPAGKLQHHRQPVFRGGRRPLNLSRSARMKDVRSPAPPSVDLRWRPHRW